MESKSLKENFKIILLTNDVRNQERFKEVFENANLDVRYTQELDQFWHLINVEPVDLCLVDVRQMSSGNRKLKDHPGVINNNIPLAFFYGTNSAALVFSTYDFNHHGLINSSMSLSGQMKSILRRVENHNNLQQIGHNLELEKEQIYKNSKKYIEENEKLKGQAFHQKMLENISKQMQGLWSEVDFFLGAGNLFKNINFVKRFSFYFLNNNGHKLISPSFDNDKYERLPAIWLDQGADNGIDIVGQNKSAQIVLDLWSGQFAQLHFFDAHDNPVAIAFLEVEEQVLESFNWIELENRLNSQFCRGLLAKKVADVSFDHELDAFEFYEYIEKKNNNFGHDPKIIKAMDFSKLVGQGLARKQGSFSWVAFAREFFSGLLSDFDFSFKISYFTPGQVLFIIDETDSDAYDLLVGEYVSKFPFWRYFESSENLVVADLNPTFCSVPFSLLAIQKYIHASVVKTGEASLRKSKVTENELSANLASMEGKPGPEKHERRAFLSRSPMNM